MHLSHGRLVSNLFLLFKCLVTVESICMYYVIVFSQCLSQMKYRLCFSILTSLLSFRCSSVTQTMSLSAWQPNGHVGAWGLGPGVGARGLGDPGETGLAMCQGLVQGARRVCFIQTFWTLPCSQRHGNSLAHFFSNIIWHKGP